jgi:hypothetical protein
MSAPALLELPAATSPEFAGLVALALTVPYAFCLLIYRYHFSARLTRPKVRAAGNEPLPEHVHGWRAALGRPEGISAPVGYMLAALAVSLLTPLDLVPPSVKTLSLVPSPWRVLLLFAAFDAIMYHVHYVQHHWRWLYHHTHARHHTIDSPTMVVALTGYLPDTVLLIIAPLHATLFLVPANLADVFVFTAGALLHLHCIHSEFFHAWDPMLRAVGLVDTAFHHGHHIKPRCNLAHFFVALDWAYGTQFDATRSSKLRSGCAEEADE